MTHDQRKFWSVSVRKLMSGFLMPSSRQTSAERPNANKASRVCTRKNGSPSQSHSWPLLSTISQEISDRDIKQCSRLSDWRFFFAHGELLGAQIVGVVYELAAHPQREQAGGDVDVKDPAPAVVVGDVAAERRPDDRREQRSDAE